MAALRYSQLMIFRISPEIRYRTIQIEDGLEFLSSLNDVERDGSFVGALVDYLVVERVNDTLV